MILSDCFLFSPVPPKVFPTPPDGNHVVRAGNSIQLTCHAEGAPEPVIAWKKIVTNTKRN